DAGLVVAAGARQPGAAAGRAIRRPLRPRTHAACRGARSQFVFHAGMGHLPTDVAPDVRSRSYTIEAEVSVPEGGAEGVLVAHGDATSGYSLFVQEGRLVHDLNIGGMHQILRSDRPVPAGRHRLGLCLAPGPMVLTPPLPAPGRG